MSGEVFIDSGAFIAFLVRRDRLHESAVELFSSPPLRWSTSALVVAETYGWFLHRLGEGEARTYRAFLERLPGLAILDTDEAHRRATWAKLDRLRGAGLTFVDASSLVWVEQRKIPTVWATDRHLAIEGAAVVPGAP